MIRVTGYEVHFRDGSMLEAMTDKAEAEALAAARGGQIRQRLIEVPAKYQAYDHGTKSYVGDKYDTAAQASRQMPKGCTVRMVPE